MRKSGKSLALFADLPDPNLPDVRRPGEAKLKRNQDNTARVVRPASAAPPSPPSTGAAPLSAITHEQLWLALRFYDFALEVLRPTRTESSEHSTVVVAEHAGRQQVVACNQLANDAGVCEGMALAAAYALAGELTVLEQDPMRELATLQRLALWAQRYTPLVVLQSPDSLLLEVKGSIHLFGDIHGLLDQVQMDLQALGFQHYAALAPTPLAALWIGRYQHGVITENAPELVQQLGALPLMAAGWPEKTVARLRGMSVRRVSDCLRLPRDGFARRIGKRYLHELDRALGKSADPQKAYQVPEKFVVRRELLDPLTNSAHIMVGLEQLLDELTAFLRGRQCGIQNVRIGLYHAGTTASVITLGMVSVCRDAKRLKTLTQQKFDQLTLPEPVVAVSMTSGELHPLLGRPGNLFVDAAHDEIEWPELVEKLRARLGVPAVTGLCLVPEHRPEQAWRYAEPGSAADGGVRDGWVMADGTTSIYRQPKRPLWMFDNPCRMPVREGLPHWQGRLKKVAGPERIESGWWDGHDAARDYFVVRNAQGLLLWVYRQRQQSSVDRWYLHGIFA